MDNVPALVAALTMAQQVFGPWVPVTVQEITKDVPEFVYQTASMGSVQKYELTDSPGCPIVEAGKNVGWSLSCK